MTVTDIQATRAMLSELLIADEQAVGRQWQVHQADGKWYGRIPSDTICSKVGDVALISTPVDPAITEDVMQRWALKVDAKTSSIASRRSRNGAKDKRAPKPSRFSNSCKMENKGSGDHNNLRALAAGRKFAPTEAGGHQTW